MMVIVFWSYEGAFHIRTLLLKGDSTMRQIWATLVSPFQSDNIFDHLYDSPIY